MTALFGYVFFVSRMLGGAIVFSALLGALIYHLGWRNDHPNGGFWPLRALLGFGGVIIAGAGLVIGSWMVVAMGILAYIAGIVVGQNGTATAA